MFGDMMGKLQEAQQQMGKMKEKLATITVVGEAEGIKAVINGNKEIVDLDIPQSIIDQGDKEQLQDLLLLAVNRGMESAEKVAAAEGASAMKGILPNIPGL